MDFRFIKTDNQGNLYYSIDWSNNGGIVDVDPSSNNYNLNSFGGWDNAICKYDSNGNFITVKHFGSTGWEYFDDFDFDEYGNWYISGIVLNNAINTTVDFDLGAGVASISTDNAEGFMLQLDSNMDFKSLKSTSGPGNSRLVGITYFDKSITVCGQYIDIENIDLTNSSLNYTSTGACYVMKMGDYPLEISNVTEEANNLLSPNPCLTYIQIKNQSFVSAQILSIQGSVVNEFKCQNDDYLKYNVSNLINGVYFLRLVDAKGQLQIHKFIKQ